jgi:hypothetical protein
MLRFKKLLLLLVVVSLLLMAVAGCARGDDDFDGRVESITDSYRFRLLEWEIEALGGVVADFFDSRTVSDNASAVFDYFDSIERMRGLRSAIDGADAAAMPALEDELGSLEDSRAVQAKIVVDQLKVEIRDALAGAGINNPFDRYLGWDFGFPPIEAVLARPPHLLVISPRDRIVNIKQVNLLPEMDRREMEEIEAQVDALGYSALVVPLGGVATYPSFVAAAADLRFTIDSMVHEWLHQYLAFTPLGFRYILDRAGIRPDYEIATMNETVANIVAKEIGAAVYAKYYPGVVVESEPPSQEPTTGFDFNRVMRETRLAVDAYLVAGETDRAEQYMEGQRQYLAENGYHIRKLNQAYFAFYGAYADGPTSVSPIGADLKTLRGQSASLKDFLDTAAGMTSKDELEEKVTSNEIK